MKQRFGQYKPQYEQMWNVKTVNSMIKRRLGSALRRGLTPAAAERSS